MSIGCIVCGDLQGSVIDVHSPHARVGGLECESKGKGTPAAAKIKKSPRLREMGGVFEQYGGPGIQMSGAKGATGALHRDGVTTESQGEGGFPQGSLGVLGKVVLCAHPLTVAFCIGMLDRLKKFAY